MSMSCKYCFQTDHTIETCKTILCRTCKELGHPHWLCKGKDNKKKGQQQSTSKLTVSTSNTSLNKMVKKEKETVSTPVASVPVTPVAPFVKEVKRDMQFYLKQSSKPWSTIL